MPKKEAPSVAFSRPNGEEAAMRFLLTSIDRALKGAERAMLLVAIVALLFIALLVTGEVVARFFPVFVVPDSVVITRGLLLVSIASGLGYATMTRAHIAVDLLFNTFNERSRKICVALALVAGLVFFVPLTLWITHEAIAIYMAGRTYFGTLRLPQWPNYFALALGFLAVSVRLTHQLVSVFAGHHHELDTAHFGPGNAE
jgi:TRAP-type C4-dicarboxylate transport system permease small subunit